MGALDDYLGGDLDVESGASPLHSYIQQQLNEHQFNKGLRAQQREIDRANYEADKQDAISQMANAPVDFAGMAAQGYSPFAAHDKARELLEKDSRQLEANYNGAALQNHIDSVQQDMAADKDMFTRVSRLQNLATTGINKLKGVAPARADLRTQMVVDPVTNVVTPQAKQINEDDVQAQELSDYLGIPKDVAAKQMAHENMADLDKQIKLTDLQYKYQHRGEVATEHKIKLADTYQRMQLRAEQQQQNETASNLETIDKMSRNPQEINDQLIAANPGHPKLPWMAAMARHLREAREQIAANKGTALSERKQAQMLWSNIEHDPDMMAAIKKGDLKKKDLEALNNMVTGITNNDVFKAATKEIPHEWDDEYNMHVFNPADGDDSGLEQYMR